MILRKIMNQKDNTFLHTLMVCIYLYMYFI